MKTRCIVNPGRSVRFEGKRHPEGSVLMLGPQDVEQLTQMGVVRVAESDHQVVTTQGDQDAQTSVVSLTAEQTALAVDSIAAAVASGELQPAGDQPSGDSAKVPATAPLTNEPEAKRPAAKKAAKSRG